MLVVMFILLMATATAVYAVHSTTYEIRAAGYGRRAMQTDTLSESGIVGAFAYVDRVGAGTLLSQQARTANAGYVVPLEPHEPDLPPGSDVFRLEGGSAGALNSSPVAAADRNLIDESSVVLGNRQAYETTLFVDVYDINQFTGVLPGFSSNGTARLKFVSATYTSRARARLPGVAADTATFHETASDARARGISGPYQ